MSGPRKGDGLICADLFMSLHIFQFRFSRHVLDYGRSVVDLDNDEYLLKKPWAEKTQDVSLSQNFQREICRVCGLVRKLLSGLGCQKSDGKLVS
jgi:hypothetical protein